MRGRSKKNDNAERSLEGIKRPFQGEKGQANRGVGVMGFHDEDEDFDFESDEELIAQKKKRLRKVERDKAQEQIDEAIAQRERDAETFL